MPQNYDLVTTESTTQVISPTVVQEAVAATIKTKPHGVIFTYWIDRITWNAGDAQTILDAVAGGVEHIMASQPVSSGTGSTQLDASGLLAGLITFTVAFDVPGSPGPPATIDVDVPVDDFGQDSIAGGNAGLNDAIAIIQAAYATLQAAAGSTPPPASKPGS